jgi:hypothetical protein
MALLRERALVGRVILFDLEILVFIFVEDSLIG